jgi:hypothetical protein
VVAKPVVKLPLPPKAPSGPAHLSARVEADRLEANRPELVLLRCRTGGFGARALISWRLGAGVRAFGYGQPLDDAGLLVQLPDANRTAMTVDCTAESEEGQVVSAAVGLGPIVISSAAADQGGKLTVDGSGFAVQRGGDDAVWLVPGRGAAVRADHTCGGASWGETRIVACLPRLARGSYQVRVESAARLALGPALPVGAP